jgi:hypothetical protein
LLNVQRAKKLIANILNRVDSGKNSRPGFVLAKMMSGGPALVLESNYISKFCGSVHGWINLPFLISQEICADHTSLKIKTLFALLFLLTRHFVL